VLQNRFLAACVRAHPDRLAAFASLQPRAGEAAVRRELARVRDDGLAGVGELSPQSQGCAADDPALAAVFAQAAKWGWPVNLHVTDPESRPYPGRVETPADELLRWIRAHPATRFILAHWGGLLPLRDATFRDLPNVWYDTAASPLLYDASVWRRFTAVVPSGRVLFGSDHPLVLYPRIEDTAGIGGLVAEARAAGMDDGVLGGNAARLGESV
jgi:predicted TIM-barrel fold metal-dependent hydrolase